MKNLLLLSILVLMIFLGGGCTKPGPGGKASINVSVLAGNLSASNVRVYIKYDSKSSPGTSADSYDDVKVTNSGGNAYFTNLRKGDYFVYAAQDTLSAGKGFTIKDKLEVIEETLQML